MSSKPPVFNHQMRALARKMHEAQDHMMEEISRRETPALRQKAELNIVTRASLFEVQKTIRRMLGIEE